MVKIYKKLRKMFSSSTEASLDRALSVNGAGFRPAFKSTAERLMDFLYLNGREDVAKTKYGACFLPDPLQQKHGCIPS